MLTTDAKRFLASTVVGAVIYILLLPPVYNWTFSISVAPAWWVALIPWRGIAHVSWMILHDAFCAVIAAIPLALALAQWGGRRRGALALALGVLTGIYVVTSAVLEYRVGRYPATAATVAFAQLVSLGLATYAVLSLLTSRPLASRWSGNER